ncbi:hypothetical protein [Thermomonospora umbrina]|uniref:Secreted protein n=1 Tax=Thermomonospora umbrina TaxID=111806 RepID=A0A3D9SWC2_9ACTN|nr:hypothetical protein [Thermomonospora umbrina]REF00139.1 hypothetical protein DFJ69_5667 [Thermomonospora umbrina]
MSTALMVVIAVVVVAVLAAAGVLLWSRSRTGRLRRQFGSEYDRAVERHGGRAAAERELRARRERHQELDLRPLDARQRELYREQWTHVQEQFVDAPESAVEHADRLVTTVMADRGYPTRDFEDRVAHLSVEHGRTLDQYRRGHLISVRAADGQASTEDLRQAMVHYRALFEDLLMKPDGDTPAASRPVSVPREARGAEAGRADTRPDPAGRDAAERQGG